MTGPEHYQIAQDLILAQTKPSVLNPKVRVLREHVSPEVIATAQVHATLALAAATALNDGGGGMSTADYKAWHQAASVAPQDGAS